MSKFTLEINTDNAAFDGGDKEAEVARILREVASKIDGGENTSFTLRDVNGNKVGEASFYN